jgi:hypothetical protein
MLSTSLATVRMLSTEPAAREAAMSARVLNSASRLPTECSSSTAALDT